MALMFARFGRITEEPPRRSVRNAVALRLWAVALCVLLFPAAELVAEEQRPLRLSFVGDIIPHDVVARMEDHGRIFQEVAPLFHASDFTFGNVESAVDPDEPWRTFPRFNMHPELLEAAIAGGMNVFSLANNHTTDLGRSGVYATAESMRRLAREHEIAYSGIREEPDGSFEVTEIEHPEYRIGFVAASGFVNVAEGAELTYLVNTGIMRNQGADLEEFLSFLEAESAEYDLTILSFHDGIEYEHHPHPRTVEFYRSAVERGVDIVWGHHSHTLQPWELIERDDGRRALVMYSMANFISGQTIPVDPEETMRPLARAGDSAVFRAAVAVTDRGASVEAVDPVLITHYQEPEGGVSARFMETILELPQEEGWEEFYRTRIEHIGRFPRGYDDPELIVE